jgi:hypothetical protein
MAPPDHSPSLCLCEGNQGPFVYEAAMFGWCISAGEWRSTVVPLRDPVKPNLDKYSKKQQRAPCKAINYFPRRQTVCIWLALLISLFMLNGCGNLARLAKDIRETGDQLRVVFGRIGVYFCKDCEIIIAVSGDDRGQEIHNYRVFERPGNFPV